MNDSFKKLELSLGYQFQDRDLLAKALSHASASPLNYERLEFLGDRVLGIAVAELLYHYFPTEKEGDLALRLAHLVSADTLAEVASDLNLGEYILHDRARLLKTTNSSGDIENNILADVCEAIIAALYLDGGLKAAQAFVKKYWGDRVKEHKDPPKDPRTRLQEWAQKKGYPLPQYRVCEQTGPDHAPLFTIEVTVQNHPSQQGTGPTKQKAGHAAAKALLEKLSQTCNQ